MADEQVARFRTLLNEFKAPYIRQLEAAGGTEEERQDIDRINKVLSQLDKLFDILKAAIEGAESSNDLERAICAVFERNNVNLRNLKAEPALKDELMRVLVLDLKTYPLTIDRKLITTFQAKHVPSFQRQIQPTGQ
jgi:hypothetical protein